MGMVLTGPIRGWGVPGALGRLHQVRGRRCPILLLWVLWDLWLHLPGDRVRVTGAGKGRVKVRLRLRHTLGIGVASGLVVG